MLMTSHPASLNHFDSALVEKRGTLDHDHRAAVMDGDPVLSDHVEAIWRSVGS